MKCSRATAVHEAAHLLVSTVLMPHEYFVVQIRKPGDTGWTPGMDAAVVRHRDWSRSPKVAAG